MTGDEAWRRLDLAVRRLVGPIPPRERHRYTSRALEQGADWIQERYPEIWEQFRDARYRAGYHR